MSDFHIIEGIVEGSPESAEELMARFARPLHRYFTVSLPDPSAAEDAVQEVFLRLVGMIRNGRLEQVRSLDAVVFTIARRLAIDLQRSSSRRPPVRSLDEPRNADDPPSGDRGVGQIGSRGPNPRDLAARTEQLQQVEAALRDLDSETREVIVLRHMENMSCREVAEVLGIAEGTVWSKLHRGLQVLRGKLASRPVRPALSESTSPTEEEKTR